MAAGLILAAGESRRMRTPKALLDYQGETFLDRLVNLFARHCAPVIVVLGAERDRIRAGTRQLGSPPARVVENPDFARGQLSSMQCGLRAVPADAAGVLFTLVDHPAVRDETIAALLDSASRAPLRIARYGGRRGHPIFFSMALAAEFLALDTAATAREVITRHSEETSEIDVDDRGVLADIDDPEAYQRLLAGLSV
jgi:molybdenum cofactor cytidylyltransferase